MLGTNSAPIVPNQSEKPTKFENGRSNLLQEIQAGAKLKHVESTPNKAPVPSAPPTVRENMMEQIKQGAQLKHVSISLGFINQLSACKANYKLPGDDTTFSNQIQGYLNVFLEIISLQILLQVGHTFSNCFLVLRPFKNCFR